MQCRLAEILQGLATAPAGEAPHYFFGASSGLTYDQCEWTIFHLPSIR